jgi:hypothetical protein
VLNDLGELGHVRFQDADVADAVLLAIPLQTVSDLTWRANQHAGQLAELAVIETAGLANDREVELVHALAHRSDEQVQLDVVKAVAGGLAQHLNATGERFLRGHACRHPRHDGETEDVSLAGAQTQDAVTGARQHDRRQRLVGLCGQYPARRGQGGLQLPHALAAGTEWHSCRLELAREVSRAEPQFQAAVGQAVRIGDVPGQIRGAHDAGIEHVRAQSHVCHVGRGHQGRERRRHAQVIGYLEYVVPQVLYLAYAIAPGRSGADVEQAGAETERLITHDSPKSLSTG